MILGGKKSKKKLGENLVRGAIYLRVLLEDIPMCLVQLYNAYRGTKLLPIDYMSLAFSIYSIYSGLINIMEAVWEYKDKEVLDFREITTKGEDY